MPKETFLNLPYEKREKIIGVLKKSFQTKPFSEVNVKEIVETLSIARGSFYQYFENLEDSYFMILEKETLDIHSLFIEKLKENQFDLYLALSSYGKAISEAVFEPSSYQIYKNRYLYWDYKLEKGWTAYQNKKKEVSEERTYSIKHSPHFAEKEEIHFIKSVIHDLIKRIFTENWTEEEFLSHYQLHIDYIQKGVHHANR